MELGTLAETIRAVFREEDNQVVPTQGLLRELPATGKVTMDLSLLRITPADEIRALSATEVLLVTQPVQDLLLATVGDLFRGLPVTDRATTGRDLLRILPAEEIRALVTIEVLLVMQPDQG